MLFFSTKSFPDLLNIYERMFFVVSLLSLYGYLGVELLT